MVSLTRQPVDAMRTATPDDIPPQWWKAYGSPRINVLVEQALSRNPNVEAGIANLKAAQEIVNAQRGLFYPSVQAAYSASRQNSVSVLSSVAGAW